METRRLAAFGLMCGFLGTMLGTPLGTTAVLAQSAGQSKEEVLAVSGRIDRLIEKRWNGLKPAAAAEPATYYRRLSLDLIGRIPSLTDARDYVDMPYADKTWRAAEALLESKEFPAHFANVLRGHILGGAASQQIAALTPGFELWLRNKLAANTGYDEIVRELLTPATSPANMRARSAFGGGVLSGNSVFFAANELKPENLAGASARAFLGVKIECAQCHAHPFADWSREQFWEFAAFFAAAQPRRRLGNNAVPGLGPEDVDSIAIPNTKKVVKARFLNGGSPKYKKDESPMQALADWVVADNNPYFARATVDVVWSYLMGSDLLEPILEPSKDIGITHPEILDELAREFVAHNHDLKFLVRAIVNTRAYQRSSVATRKLSPEDYLLFTHMPVRGLSPEQVYDSVVEATYYQNGDRTVTTNLAPFQPLQMTPRNEFVSRFLEQGKRTESATSILQALFLMNGSFLADRLKPENNRSLEYLIQQPTPTEKKLESLFLMVLSRLPRPDERARLIRYLDSREHSRTLPDVYWALLNSGEFLLNH